LIVEFSQPFDLYWVADKMLGARLWPPILFHVFSDVAILDVQGSPPVTFFRQALQGFEKHFFIELRDTQILAEELLAMRMERGTKRIIYSISVIPSH
jgi:hypothetical protein